MIARREVDIVGQRAWRYIALCLQALADGREVWTPTSGDAQAIGETSLTAAARACIRSMDERFTHLRVDVAIARGQAQRDRPNDPLMLDRLRRIEEHAIRLHREVVHLLDEPTEHDLVQLPAKFGPAQLDHRQLRAARLLAGLGLRDLATRSGRALSTIQGIESGSTRRPRTATIEALRSVLAAAGIEFDSAGWIRLRSDDTAVLTR